MVNPKSPSFRIATRLYPVVFFFNQDLLKAAFNCDLRLDSRPESSKSTCLSLVSGTLGGSPGCYRL